MDPPPYPLNPPLRSPCKMNNSFYIHTFFVHIQFYTAINLVKLLYSELADFFS